MNDYILHGYIENIKRAVESGEMKTSKTISIEMIDFEKFKFKLNNEDGIVSIDELINIGNFIEKIISTNAHSIRSLIHLDKNSPRYWGDIEKGVHEDEDENGKVKKKTYYRVSVNLEDFMEDYSNSSNGTDGFHIPDNYHLAEVVMKEFKKAGYSLDGIEDNHCRELADWEIKTKKTAEKLVKFIQKKYVDKKVKEIKNFGNVKKIDFSSDKMEIIYR